MPNKDNLRLWVAALRSGEFKQGRGQLRTLDDEYCCLGVACETAIRAGVRVPHYKHGTLVMYDDTTASLPAAVRDWLGIQAKNPIVGVDPHACHVSAWSANDLHKWTFDDIAAGIERHYGLVEA